MGGIGAVPHSENLDPVLIDLVIVGQDAGLDVTIALVSLSETGGNATSLRLEDNEAEPGPLGGNAGGESQDVLKIY